MHAESFSQHQSPCLPLGPLIYLVAQENQSHALAAFFLVVSQRCWLWRRSSYYQVQQSRTHSGVGVLFAGADGFLDGPALGRLPRRLFSAKSLMSLIRLSFSSRRLLTSPKVFSSSSVADSQKSSHVPKIKVFHILISALPGCQIVVLFKQCVYQPFVWFLERQGNIVIERVAF